MKRPTTIARLGAVALIGALALAGCGSDDSGDDSSSSDNSKSRREGGRHADHRHAAPATGDLAYLGPPEFAGVDLAINEINDAGGVNGKPIKQIKSDSGDGTPDIAGASVDKLINGKSDVVVGAASSSVSLSRHRQDHRRRHGALLAREHRGRVRHLRRRRASTSAPSPSDRLQGQVIGNLAVEDGFKNVAVLARQDAYGEGLAQQVVDTLKEKGAGVASHVLYNADAENYTAEVNEVAASKPDAIVLVAFEETTKIVPQLVSKGFGPDKVQYYFVDGNMADYSRDPQAGRPDRREGHLPGARRAGPDLQRRAEDDQPGPEGLHLRSAVLRRRHADRPRGAGCR